MLTIFRREYSLVANSALRERHNIIYILRCCYSRFLALLIKPQIRSVKMNQFINPIYQSLLSITQCVSFIP